MASQTEIDNGVKKTTKAIGHGARNVTRKVGRAFQDGAHKIAGKKNYNLANDVQIHTFQNEREGQCPASTRQSPASPIRCRRDNFTVKKRA